MSAAWSLGFRAALAIPCGGPIMNFKYSITGTALVAVLALGACNDKSEDMYRYNDGYIYRVDPKTQLITAVINAIV